MILVNHMGLGDHISLNGMVRLLSEKNQDDNINIVVLQNHKDTIEYMYRDLKNIKIIYIDNVEIKHIQSQIINNIVKSEKLYPLSSYNPYYPIPSWAALMHAKIPTVTNWAIAPYIQMGINPYYMHTKFHVERDEELEDEIFKKYAPKDKDYIFIHDKKNKIKPETDLEIVRPSDDVTNIFAFLKLIDKAKEIHCVNSSFAWLIELTKIGGKKIMYTRYSADHHSCENVMSAFTDWNFDNSSPQ